MLYIWAVLCVVGLAIGQILFKVSAAALAASGTLFSFRALAALFSAMLLYAITSVAWVWILQKIELGRVYPVMALAFVLVPIGSHIVFGERFSTQYFVGISLIMLGIAVVSRS
ncbi:4-amino-4-deoxy-L-arabinose-phospho-UDP flippase [Pseudomonas mohnii]|nr:4-amino-4-deoxy-L-arabinose-phospho-UDP flippase [Pseudomonas mohnii]